MPPHGIGLSVKMTVDNNAGDPDIPGYPALLSTDFSDAGIIFHRHCPGWCLQQWTTGIIRNHRPFCAKTRFFIFYEMHKRYHSSFCGSRIGWMGCFATISKPFISSRYWSGEISSASSRERGQLKAPISRRLYKRRNPSPSHKSPLIRSFLFPQNRKRVSLSYGSRWNWKRMMFARPSIPRRRSV